jgi:CheY-like chemotaxis protein
VRRRAFEPFFSTKQNKGAGLGLATVYGIARHNGGYAVITSVPGRGTTVTVGFPEAVSNEATDDDLPTDGIAANAGTLDPLAAPATGERVLVVEDHPLVAQSIVHSLVDAGYRVTRADGADQALAAVRDPAKVPDVLVTDVQLPGTSGVALAEAARRERPGLPVLFVTGSADHDPRFTMGTVLRKPFTSTALVRAVREAIVGG